MINLFDVHRGFKGAAKGRSADCPGPRDATDREIRAYLHFIAAREGIAIPAGAQYGARGITVGATYDRNGNMLTGQVVVPMPGYGQSQLVTCEILDDAGDVVRTFPLPADKRGKLPMTAKQVQDWSGLAPVKAKRGKAAPVAPIVEEVAPTAIAAPVAVEAPEEDRQAAPWPQDYVTGAEAAGRRARLDGQDRAVPSWCSGPAHKAWLKGWAFADAYLSDMPEMPASDPHETPEAPAPRVDTPEAVDAPTSPEIASPEPSNETYELPAAPTADASDPIAAIEARLADLERAVRALSVESAAEPAPTVAKRTPAHERMVRRAWAERKAMRVAKAHARLGQAQYDALKAERDALVASHDEWEALQHRTWTEAMGYKIKRRRAVERARRMIAAARADAKLQRQNAAGARFELAKIKRDMADPTQPERASDIARLVQDRDAARNASAALQGRAERAEAARDMLAGKFEEMISRVCQAETAMRKAGIAA